MCCRCRLCWSFRLEQAHGNHGQRPRQISYKGRRASGGQFAANPDGFLRGEEKFDGLDALVAQMRRDEAEARAMLASARPLSTLDRAVAFPS